MQAKWIVNRNYDLFFFIGSVLFSWLFLALYNLNPFPQKVGDSDFTLTAVLLYFVFTALFDHPHIFQMVSRTYYDPIEFNRRRKMYTWGFAGFVLVGWLILFFDLEKIWSDVYSTVGAWHIIGQNAGFIKIYRGKAGQKKDREAKIEAFVFRLLSVCALFQYFKPYDGGQNLVWLIFALPDVFFLYVETLIYFGLAYLCYQILKEIRRKEFNGVKWLFMGAVLVTDFVMFSQTQVPLIILVVLETAYHDIQYQGWTAHFQRKRFSGINIARNFFILAIVYGLVVGYFEYMAETGSELFAYIFMPFTMFVFFHYCIDGSIWKVSKAPELQKVLK